MKTCALLVVAAAGCGAVAPAKQGPAALDAGQPADAAAPVKCSPSAKFGAPVPIPGLSQPNFEEHLGRLSSDELTLYVTGIVPTKPPDIYVTHRRSLTEPFDQPALLPSLNSPTDDTDADISSDGLTVWMTSKRGANGHDHVYVATRTSTLSEFSEPVIAAVINSDGAEIQPFITADNRELWFSTDRPGNPDIWRSVRVGQDFTAPEPVPSLNSGAVDWSPTLSEDLLTVYFASQRPGGKGALDVWTAHRSTPNDGFPNPVLVDEVNTAVDDLPTWLSSDNCRLYLTSNSSGNYDLFVATRTP